MDTLNTANTARNATLEYYLGPELIALLHDADVAEISLNDDGKLWVERSGQPMACIGSMEAHAAHGIISLVADSMNLVVDEKMPIVEGEFPLDGSRFEGMIPPVVRAPAFSLRKHVSKLIPLENYVLSGSMPSSVRQVISEAVTKRQNILVVGGTGSGKTTLVNSIIHEMAELCPDDRVLIFEDSRELKTASPNSLFLRSTALIPLRILLKTAMRLRPDRIHVGEVRGPEALDLLMTWNTGHPGGVSTIHANSAAAGLIRLSQLISMASASPMPELIGEAVDLVLFIHRDRGGRKVKEVLQCKGYDSLTQTYILETLYAYSAA